MKTRTAFLVLAMAVSPAWSGEAATIDSLVACTKISDSLERVVCFDREIAPFAKAQTSPALSPVQTSPVTRNAPQRSAPLPRAAPDPATSPPPPAASFGQEQLGALPSSKEEKQLLHARIASLRQVDPGAYFISLDNGQAWRHEDKHLGSYLREGEAITISKAALGTYRLIRDDGDSKNWIRVTRIR